MAKNGGDRGANKKGQKRVGGRKKTPKRDGPIREITDEQIKKWREEQGIK